MLKSACDKSSVCAWQVSPDNTCGWCQLESEKKLESVPTYCDSCAIHESNEDCLSADECEWCNLNYCSKKGACAIRCELIATEAECGKAASACAWCSTALSCIDIKARCNECSDFTKEFCPRGCVCSSQRNTAVTVAITLVVACFALIAVLTVFLLILKRKYGSQEDKSNEMTALSDMQLAFNSKFGVDDDYPRLPCATFAQEDISKFVSCSGSVVTFDQTAPFLLLNKTYSSAFKLLNKTEESQTVELFTQGFREKHKINFIPQKSISIFTNFLNTLLTL